MASLCTPEPVVASKSTVATSSASNDKAPQLHDQMAADVHWTICRGKVYGGQSRSYVVVREVCFPEWNAPIPSNIESIKQNCNPISEIGYFASVSVANADNHDLPPYRGHGMHVRFTGIEEL